MERDSVTAPRSHGDGDAVCVLIASQLFLTVISLPTQFKSLPSQTEITERLLNKLINLNCGVGVTCKILLAH